MDQGGVQLQATQSDKDKGVGWSRLPPPLSFSLYNEDAPRQLLSPLAALGEVMARPERRAFRKRSNICIADLFIQKLNSSHMKTKPAIEKMSFFMAFPKTYICMSSLEL